MKSLKKQRENLRKTGAFYTPVALAEYMRDIAVTMAPWCNSVYDPTCGNGNLLAVFPDEVQKYGQELDNNELEEAKSRLKNFTGVAGDTLQNPAFFGQKFDIIVANPPFSTQWQPPMPLYADERFQCLPALPPANKADFAFLLHILHYLSDNGVAVVICGTGILYRSQSEGKIREYLIQKNYISRVVFVDNPEFEDTSIPVAILVLQKNKQNNTITFVNKESGEEKEVSIQEVAKNDYQLTKSRFLPDFAEKEPEIDILKTHAEARAQMIKAIEKDLEMDKMICQLSNFNHQEYVDMLLDTIKKYKENT